MRACADCFWVTGFAHAHTRCEYDCCDLSTRCTCKDSIPGNMAADADRLASYNDTPRSGHGFREAVAWLLP
eukprot:361382-Chlamydomonas_euryale.AAC.14